MNHLAKLSEVFALGHSNIIHKPVKVSITYTHTYIYLYIGMFVYICLYLFGFSFCIYLCALYSFLSVCKTARKRFLGSISPRRIGDCFHWQAGQAGSRHMIRLSVCPPVPMLCNKVYFPCYCSCFDGNDDDDILVLTVCHLIPHSGRNY